MKNCVICLDRDITTITVDAGGFRYYRCNGCGYITIDEGQVLPSEEEKARYQTHENTRDNEGYVRMFRDFIDTCITPYQDGISTALDFGCGPGPVLAELLREQGFRVDIYDPHFFPDRVYENTSYDLITATETFEHLKDPVGTMTLLARHLNTNGVLAVMTLFPPADVEQFTSWWYRKDPTHISFYTPGTFDALARRVGMKLVFTDGKNLSVMRKT